MSGGWAERMEAYGEFLISVLLRSYSEVACHVSWRFGALGYRSCSSMKGGLSSRLSCSILASPYNVAYGHTHCVCVRFLILHFDSSRSHPLATHRCRPHVARLRSVPRIIDVCMRYAVIVRSYGSARQFKSYMYTAGASRALRSPTWY